MVKVVLTSTGCWETKCVKTHKELSLGLQPSIPVRTASKFAMDLKG